MSIAKTGYKHTKEAKKKISLGHIGILLGDKNSQWKGGIPQKRGVNGRWTKRMVKQDEGCLFPGCENGTKLELHHIIMWKDSKELRQSRNNVITLCKSCHRKVTKRESQYENLFKMIVNCLYV